MSEDDELERIGRDQAFYNVEEARETVRKAEAATSRIESMTERLSQIETELAELLTKRDTAKAGIDDAIDERYTTMKAELEQTRSDHADLREQSARYASELDSFRKQIAGLEDLESELKERRQAVYKKRDDAEEWAYLQKACGPDGIQALELDALAPSISDVANGILESAYGARFIVQFQTTKMSSDGKKQLEDFLIQVYDTEHGTEQELSTLSGGESVWIKRAIYDAFGIIRDRNTGLRFLTSFQDETDGALDPEAKEAYARMLHAAHKQAGRSHTILITHSREVQELVGQRIEMDELARVKEAVPA
jgi:exonuclease SbcC